MKQLLVWLHGSHTAEFWYFPGSMNDSGLMCCVAELLLDTTCMKWMNSRVQKVIVMEDGRRLRLWYDSVFPGYCEFYSLLLSNFSAEESEATVQFFSTSSLSTFFLKFFLEVLWRVPPWLKQWYGTTLFPLSKPTCYCLCACSDRPEPWAGGKLI